MIECRLLMVVGVLVAGAAPAVAQGLGALSSSAGDTVLVEREKVRERAAASFGERVDAVSAGIEDSAENLTAATERVREQFERELDQELAKLEGDGILVVSELAEIDELRSDFERELTNVVSAVRRGFEPPPLERDFDSPWDYTKDLARYTFVHRNTPLEWLGFAAWILGGIFLAWALNRGAQRARERFSRNDRPALAKVFDSLGGPLYLSAISLGLYFGLQHLWIPAAVLQPLGTTANVLLVGALFWLCWNLCPALAASAMLFMRRSYGGEFGGHIESVLERVLRMLVLAGLAVVVMRVILDTSLSSLFTSLGILGLALYFILRGTLENVAASFTIYGDKPFRVGDLVIYDGEWSHVEAIGFRSTKVRTLKGHLVTIPNQELIENSVHNVGARPSIRRRFRVGLPYDTDPDKVREAMEILHDILDDHEGMPEDDPPRVAFEDLAASSLDLLVQYNYEPPDFWEALAFDTKVNLAIITRFAEADIELAFPTETQVLTTPADADPLRFEMVGGQARDERAEDRGED